jgi:hypothetical protein
MLWNAQWQQRGPANLVQHWGTSVVSSPVNPHRFTDILNRCCVYIKSGVLFGVLRILKMFLNRSLQLITAATCTLRPLETARSGETL